MIRVGRLTRVAAAVLALAVGCGDDAPDRAGQAADAAADAGLPEEVQEFLRLAASTTEATYEVTYEPSDKGVTVSVAQRPPERRVDLREGQGDRAVVHSRFVTDDGAFVCTRSATLPWECEEIDGPGPTVPTAFADEDVEVTVERLRADRDRFDFDLREREVAGAPATCLVTTPTTGTSRAETLCISEQGVPLLVERESGRLEAASYSDEPGEDAFSLPADAG